jgi:hypothetical protein
MRWIYDAYGNADLEEVEFAEATVSHAHAVDDEPAR